MKRWYGKSVQFALALLTAAGLVTAVGVQVAGASTGSATSTPRGGSGTGPVHVQSGGCLTASHLTYGARVQIQPCRGGQRQTWVVHVVSGNRIMLRIRSTLDCVVNEGRAVIRSCYDPYAWMTRHNYGPYSGITSRGKTLTSFGSGWAAQFVGWSTANAGRQMWKLPHLS